MKIFGIFLSVFLLLGSLVSAQYFSLYGGSRLNRNGRSEVITDEQENRVLKSQEVSLNRYLKNNLNQKIVKVLTQYLENEENRLDNF